MISFIVIGRNEGWRLTLCLDSIVDVVNTDNISDYEIIYVDSQSTDDSITRCNKYQNLRIYQINGECNAAIARNVGAKEAKGSILFFIDGDMEIFSGFLPKVIENNQLSYPFVSGIFEDVLYDKDWQYIKTERRYKLVEGMQDQYEIVTGGLFLITADLWQLVGGLDTRLVRSQDYDLGLRLSEKGLPLYRKAILLAKHHTVSYSGRQDFSNYAKYTAILFRKHVKNMEYIKLFAKSQYTAIILLGSFIVVFFSKYWFFFFLFFYLLSLLYKVYSISRKEQNSKIFLLLWHIFRRDVILLFSIVSYFPKTKQLNYIKID